MTNFEFYSLFLKFEVEWIDNLNIAAMKQIMYCISTLNFYTDLKFNVTSKNCWYNINRIFEKIASNNLSLI